jgi:ABC-2 type transport system permease protein
VNPLFRLVYRNLRANLDRTTLFFELVFPLFFIFVQGFAFTGIVPPFELQEGVVISYPVFLAAGAVTLTVINSGTNAGTQLWFDRKNGMFEQILMGPFTRAQYLMSIIVTTLLIGVVASVLVFVIALPVLGAPVLGARAFLLTGTALFLGTLFFGSFALIMSVRLKSSEAFQVVSTFFFFVFLFTSSVFYPAARAPEPLRSISLLNPLTYTTDIFRAGLFNIGTELLPNMIIPLALEAFILFIASVFAFRRIRVS